MRVPRYWRMKQQEYQLTGCRTQDGSTSMIQRPVRATEAHQLQETNKAVVTIEAA